MKYAILLMSVFVGGLVLANEYTQLTDKLVHNTGLPFDTAAIGAVLVMLATVTLAAPLLSLLFSWILRSLSK